MATLEGKKIVVVGGSSGIGYAVAKASLLSLAAHVVVGSSSQEKVDAAVVGLRGELSTRNLRGEVSGALVDAKDSASVKTFIAGVGEIDHLVWTSGDAIRPGFKDADLDQLKDIYDVRFWGAAVAAQAAKIKTGGSITLTIGSVLYRPKPTWSVLVGVAGAVDALARGLALDLAPVRVNVVSSGVVKTQLWDRYPVEMREKIFAATAAKLPVKHVAEPEEMAEAYLFLMKCGFITGQTVEVDGGERLS